MRLPKDKLTEVVKKPRLFLCEVNKEKICELETTALSGNFKFNAYSELTCTIPRKYTNITTGDTQVNPHYDRIEALRIMYLEGFGYFEIQDPEIVSDGVKEVKNVNAYSLEYTLSQKYLDNIKINTGEVDSIEVIEANGGLIVPVTLYNAENPKLSLLDIVLEKVYGWTIGYIDESLKTMGRTFEISRVSVYDFIVQDVCEKFNCFAVFDTVNNKINLYAESLITKRIGDGITTTFTVNPVYDQVGSVSIDGYRTTAYVYDSSSGKLTFETAPSDGSKIEIVDGSQSKWVTDVYVTFNNLAQEVNISYSAEDIKTVLTVKGSDDLDIREVNMGLPYIVDLSYYYSIDWMGQDLYDAYTKYLQVCDDYQDQYIINSKKMLELKGHITYENQRLSLQYSIAENVNSLTVGTYYVRGGTDPDYYYTEVSLPDEYDSNVEHYYTLSGTDLNEEKFANLYKALQVYFTSGDEKNVNDINELSKSFAFMIENTIDVLTSALSAATNLTQKNEAVLSFFDEMWNQLGFVPLDSLYYKPYKKIEQTNVEAGWDDESNANYWLYYPVTLVLSSLDKDKKQREATIQIYQDEYNKLEKENNEFTSQSSIYNNFTPAQLIRLSAFLREDEYTDNNFEELSTDTIESLIQKKQELLECGRVELAKLCEPKLEFSMNMANIYALPEFEPIIDQFQLGNLINVAIRDDYIKRARLLEVDINFDDFPDFSCSFGELTNLKTPSSIHADLLASALTAGKSVAGNASYWNKGADIATELNLKIQDGLISAIGGLYNKDQSVKIDDMGILLRKLNEDGTYSPYQAWIRNNTILLSEDGFSETSVPSLGLGEFVVDGKTFYGILAKAILSGYIEGSTIVGGKINIGDGTFVVDETGHVTMKASSIDGYVEKDNVISSINQSAESVTIDANKISLAGKNIDLTSDNITINSTNFSVTADGQITASNGKIANWTISANRIYSQNEDGTYNSINTQNGSSFAFAVGAESLSVTTGAPFRVTQAGKLYATDAVIKGDITANSLALGSEVTIPYSKLSGTPDLDIYIAKDGTVGSTPSSSSTGFKVSSSGLLTASNAVIYGTIYASDGTIAGYNIGSGGCYDNAIYKRVSNDSAAYEVGMKATSGTTDLAFYVKKSTDSWRTNDETFFIRNNGALYCSNADITGKIIASSGAIGGWNVGALGSYTQSLYSTYCAADTPSTTNPEYAVFMRSWGGPNNLAIGVKKRTSSSTDWTKADNPFYVRKDGFVSMENAYVKGEIYATSGTIDGNLEISGALTHTRGNYKVTLRGVQSDVGYGVFYITDSSSGSDKYPVRINGDGSASFTNVSISGDSTIAAACIPNLSASKITSGTISTDRLSSSVITTSNFSAKTLSTGNLTVDNGCYVGSWYIGSGGLTSGNVHITTNALVYGVRQCTWADVTACVQAYSSDQRLKNNINIMDDKYSILFDNLKPITYKFNSDGDSAKIRMGFIAQDVQKAIGVSGLENLNCVYSSEGTEEEYLRLSYTDFIALNTWQIQKLKTRVEELEKKLAALEA